MKNTIITTDTTEEGFENTIDEYLLENGGYIERKPENYDKSFCIDRELVLEFIEKTQKKTWDKHLEQNGSFAADKFFKRLDEEIRELGVLEVLRKGIKDCGNFFRLAYFKPSSSLNPEANSNYQENIFSVIRQLRYSQKNENSIDMVMFLNGLPIFTVELKNQFTGQTIENAIVQYKTDRNPAGEPFLAFKRCLVHFAMDTDLTYMTTCLAGIKTRFLPFNKGDNGSAGNPVNPNGYKTAYMWENIWKKEVFLNIIQKFMHLSREEIRDSKGKKTLKETLIFPRYHQFDAVKRIIDDVKENGAGKNYLIQHSAGSGKSNSIAWTAHRLSELHNSADQKIFDSIIVITDRRVLDKQLRDTIVQFEQTAGVVKPITSGSSQLASALENGEKIITTTLQKFPFVLDKITEIKGRNFAVLVDEAHSSQTGENVKSLKEVLKNEEEEDPILSQMKSRQKMNNLSFVAFTATPKQKTLEIFGTKNSDGSFFPFSVYSMKQAIEEGFIKDVLKNYTSYKLYFNLLKKVENDPEYQKKKAVKLMTSYVEKHDHTIKSKVALIVENFLGNIENRLEGKAKAMIVTASRLHAVKYKLAIDEYIKEKGYTIKTLVAFSGEVEDGGLTYTEPQMNNGLPENNLPQEFKKEEFKFLIVADKYQTGFDQPLLSAMYVDKKLGGVNCVQTLSRLNRTALGKDEVFVLDFVNDTEEIKDSFQPYYTTTVLAEETDPNILHDLQRDILNYHIFDEIQINTFVDMYIRNVNAGRLSAFLDGIIVRYSEELDEQKQQEMKQKVGAYTKKYAFISQIISFEDSSLEKLYIFLRFLKKKFPITKEELPLEILENIDIENLKLTKKGTKAIALENEIGTLDPMTGNDRGGGASNNDEDLLSKILKDVNDRFGTEFSEEDKVILNNLSERLLKDDKLVGIFNSGNAKDNIKKEFDKTFNTEKIKMFSDNMGLYQKLDGNKDLNEYVQEKMFDFLLKKAFQERR